MLNATDMTLQCVLLVGALFCGTCQAFPPWVKETSPYDSIQCPDDMVEWFRKGVTQVCGRCVKCKQNCIPNVWPREKCKEPPEKHYHYDMGLACCPCSQCPMHGSVHTSVVMQCDLLYRKKLLGDPNKVCRTKTKSNCKSYDSILEELARTTDSPVARTVLPTIANTTKNPLTTSSLSEISTNLPPTPSHIPSPTDKVVDTDYIPNLMDCVIGALATIGLIVLALAFVVVAMKFDCLSRTKRFSQRCRSDRQEPQHLQTNRNDDGTIAVQPAPESTIQTSPAQPGVPKKEDGVREMHSVHTGSCSDEKQRAEPIPIDPHHHTPRATQGEPPAAPQPVIRALPRPPNQAPGSNVTISPVINVGSNSVVFVGQNLSHVNVNRPPQQPSAPYASPADQHTPCPSCDRREGLTRRRQDHVVNRPTFNMSNDYPSSSDVCRHTPVHSPLANNRASVADTSRTFREHGTEAECSRLLSSTTENVRGGGQASEADGRNSPGYDSQPLSMPYLPNRDLSSDSESDEAPRRPPS